MASVAQSGIAEDRAAREPGVAAFIDRWIYVFMAALFVATVLVGFVPDSIAKVSGIEAGIRPPFPAVLHVHAVLMGSWLLLLLTQTVLMATGRPAIHKQLGIAGMVLAPAMVLTGFVLVPTMVRYNWPLIAALPPQDAETTRKFVGSLVAAQIAAGAMFAVFVALALRARKTDFETHKRLMILATAIPLPAAIDRIDWLPSTYPASDLAPALYTVLWIAPMLVWDLVRHRRLQRAYVIWFAIFVPVTFVVNCLWWSPWWIGIAQRLMGVSG